MASLKKLDNQSLAKKLAARDGVLLLNNISEIQPEVMRAVAAYKGGLSLNGLAEISEENAKALASHSGTLWLWGVKSISGKALKAILSHDGDVYFRDLTGLPAPYKAALKMKWGFEEEK